MALKYFKQGGAIIQLRWTQFLVPGSTSQGVFQSLPLNYFPKLNKQNRREIFSIYKIRTYNYNFHKDLQDRYLSIENPPCICGEFDKFEHFLDCDCYIDMREWITEKIGKCDIKRLTSYDQNYINQFPKNKLEYIDLQINIFIGCYLKGVQNYLNWEKKNYQKILYLKEKKEKIKNKMQRMKNIKKNKKNKKNKMKTRRNKLMTKMIQLKKRMKMKV